MNLLERAKRAWADVPSRIDASSQAPQILEQKDFRFSDSDFLLFYTIYKIIT